MIFPARVIENGIAERFMVSVSDQKRNACLCADRAVAGRVDEIVRFNMKLPLATLLHAAQCRDAPPVQLHLVDICIEQEGASDFSRTAPRPEASRPRRPGSHRNCGIGSRASARPTRPFPPPRDCPRRSRRASKRESHCSSSRPEPVCPSPAWSVRRAAPPLDPDTAQRLYRSAIRTPTANVEQMLAGLELLAEYLGQTYHLL